MRYLIVIIVLLASNLHAQTAWDKGVSLYNASQFDEAENYFRQQLQFQPQHLPSQIYLADILAQRKEWLQAWQAYNRLVKLHPTLAELHYKTSGALAMYAKTQSYWFQFSHREEIKLGFLQAISLNPAYVDAHWAMVEYGLAVPSWLGGGVDLAQQYAQKLQRISPVDGYLAQGRIAVKSNEWKIAQINYEKAFEVGKSLHTFTTLKQFYLKRNLTQLANALDLRWAKLAKSN